MALKNAKSKSRQWLGILITFLAIAAALFGILMLTECRRDEPAHTASTDKDGDVIRAEVLPWSESSDAVAATVDVPTSITDKKTNIRYVVCNEGLYAEGIFKSDGPYITLNVEDTEGKLVTLGFYPIKAQVKESFLALELTSGHLLYRADTIPELTIDVFAPVSAGIYMGNICIDNFYSAESAGKTDAEDGTPYVLAIKEALMQSTVGEPSAWSDKGYTFRLYSSQYPGVYYTVLFKVASDDTAYLYDSVYDRLYAAPEKLVARIIG